MFGPTQVASASPSTFLSFQKERVLETGLSTLLQMLEIMRYTLSLSLGIINERLPKSLPKFMPISFFTRVSHC